MGEGYPNDGELMKLVSSANIACGFHAGDIDTMRRTVELAISNNVAVGAHPGYRDKENFGRRAMTLTADEIFDIVKAQLDAMITVCGEFDVQLHHLKPHGALYNQAARDAELARTIARAAREIDEGLILYGLSGSALISQGELAGLHTASEVFADRTYAPDGSLTPRSEQNALINDADLAAGQAIRMVEEGAVVTTSGNSVTLRADTICVHGDGPHAVEFAASIRQALEARNIRVETL